MLKLLGASYNENKILTTPDLNGSLFSSVGTNLRPFLETLSSSLPSTPVFHESCCPCYHFEWVSFGRSDPFRHAMVVVFRYQLCLAETSAVFGVSSPREVKAKPPTIKSTS